MEFITLRAKRNAKPLQFATNDALDTTGKSGTDLNMKENLTAQPKPKLPMAVFSHGIMGNAFIYSYQCMSLASNGTLVLSMDHTDGSAIGATKKDGSFVDYDASLNNDPDYPRARRKQIEFRTQEFVAASKALRLLNESNIRELEDLGISFVGTLNVNDMAACGHSFGGATALVACQKHPSLYSCYIGHEPALDWMPDDVRYALFEESKIEKSRIQYNGGTGGYETSFQVPMQKASHKKTLHHLDLFFLYSHEWMRKG